jgi:sugar phosphate isomerase/epimerase
MSQPMINIFASSTMLFGYKVEEVLNIAKKMQYSGVEIWHIHLLKTGEIDNCEYLSDIARQLGLSLSFHALSWDLNFTSKIGCVRETSLQVLEESIDTAALLGAAPIVIHPGRNTIPGDSPNGSWTLLVEGVKRLCNRAQEYGLMIGLELMEHIPNEFFITPQDANLILSEILAPNLGITFDAAHVPLEDDVLDYLKQIQRVVHIHLSDINSHQRHIALNTGVRDYTELIRYLSDKYDGYMVIEGMENRRSEQLMKENINAITGLWQSVQSV